MSEAFSIFDILREKYINEAEGDETPDAGGEEASAAGDSGEASGDDSGTEDGGDDFDIDASLDDEEGGDDSGSESGDDTSDDMGADDSSSDDGGGSSSSSGSDSGDEEVNDNNTDIFATLTAEEQQIKIKELKDLYGNMYASCNELLDRLSDLEYDEKNLGIMTRISNALIDLKKYISEYLITVFPKKSFVENDIQFNKFLMILNSIKDIMEKFAKKIEKDEE